MGVGLSSVVQFLFPPPLFPIATEGCVEEMPLKSKTWKWGGSFLCCASFRISCPSLSEVEEAVEAVIS